MVIRKSKRRASLASRLFLSALLLLAVTLFLKWAFDKSEPLLIPLAEREFTALVTETVYDATRDMALDTVVTAHYSKDGSITHLYTDTAKLNDCTLLILETLEEVLGDEDLKIAIPIGDIVGEAISLGQGPDILAELNQYRSVDAFIRSSFEGAGINQTLHRLTLELKVEAVVLMPGMNAHPVSASLSLPIAETLVVGDIPEAYIVK